MMVEFLQIFARDFFFIATVWCFYCTVLHPNTTCVVDMVLKASNQPATCADLTCMVDKVL